MKIEAKCPCGASLSLEDDSFALPGGRADEKGRRFLVQVQLDDWLERHQHCPSMERFIRRKAL